MRVSYLDMSGDVGADGREVERREVAVGSVREISVECRLNHSPQEPQLPVAAPRHNLCHHCTAL